MAVSGLWGTILIVTTPLDTICQGRLVQETGVAAPICRLLLRPNWAMGNNQYGQLGAAVAMTNPPAQIVPSDVVAIAAGAQHSLFVKTDGSLWGMGYNVDGELGDGTNINRFLPEQIVSSGVVAVAAGANHSLFLKSDASLWAMGLNNYGQLGDGSHSNAFAPRQIVPGGVIAIAGGYAHSLFIRRM